MGPQIKPRSDAGRNAGYSGAIGTPNVPPKMPCRPVNPLRRETGQCSTCREQTEGFYVLSLALRTCEVHNAVERGLHVRS